MQEILDKFSKYLENTSQEGLQNMKRQWYHKVVPVWRWRQPCWAHCNCSADTASPPALQKYNAVAMRVKVSPTRKPAGVTIQIVAGVSRLHAHKAEEFTATQTVSSQWLRLVPLHEETNQLSPQVCTCPAAGTVICRHVSAQRVAV